MGLKGWSKTPGLPPLCGCGVRPYETEEAGLLRRRCLRCGAGESLSLSALKFAASDSDLAKELRAAHAR